MPAGVRQPGPATISPSIHVTMPSSVTTRSSVAHTAIAPGLASAAATLVVTARNSGVERSSNNGMATTLDAKIGAASTLPSISQPGNNSDWSSRTTTRRKSIGPRTGAAAKRVISAADVSTSRCPPVPAQPEAHQPRIARCQAASAVTSVGRSPCWRARLTAYSPWRPARHQQKAAERAGQEPEAVAGERDKRRAEQRRGGPVNQARQRTAQQIGPATAPASAAGAMAPPPAPRARRLSARKLDRGVTAASPAQRQPGPGGVGVARSHPSTCLRRASACARQRPASPLRRRAGRAAARRQSR